MLARIVFPWRFLVMLFRRTLAFLLACSILLSSLSFSQTDKSRSSPVVAYSGTETGIFTIIFGGEQIGQEKFSITQDSTGYRATAEIRLTLEREKEKAIFVLKPVLTFNKFFEPSGYQVTQEDGLTKRSVRVIFKPDKSERIYETGSEHDTREIALKSDVCILDDNAFHHYIILAKRFDFTKGGIQEFSAFVPQQFLAGSISISDKGKESVRLGGKDSSLQHLLVDTGELQISLWLDDRHELKKISVPESNVEVIRE
jgi:hypothetical protein